MEPKFLIRDICISEDHSSYYVKLDNTTNSDKYTVYEKFPRVDIDIELSLRVIGSGNFGEYTNDDGEIDHREIILGILNGKIKITSI